MSVIYMPESSRGKDMGNSFQSMFQTLFGALMKYKGMRQQQEQLDFEKAKSSLDVMDTLGITPDDATLTKVSEGTGISMDAFKSLMQPTTTEVGTYGEAAGLEGERESYFGAPSASEVPAYTTTGRMTETTEKWPSKTERALAAKMQELKMGEEFQRDTFAAPGGPLERARTTAEMQQDVALEGEQKSWESGIYQKKKTFDTDEQIRVTEKAAQLNKELKKYERELSNNPTPLELAQISNLRASAAQHAAVADYYKTNKSAEKDPTLKNYLADLKKNDEFFKMNESLFVDKSKKGKVVPKEYTPGSEELQSVKDLAAKAGVAVEEQKIKGFFRDTVILRIATPSIQDWVKTNPTPSGGAGSPQLDADGNVIPNAPRSVSSPVTSPKQLSVVSVSGDQVKLSDGSVKKMTDGIIVLNGQRVRVVKKK